MLISLRAVINGHFRYDSSAKRNYDSRRRLSYLRSAFGLGINDFVLVHKIKHSAVWHLQQFKLNIINYESRFKV